jgi:hypothetical protein
VSASSPKLAKRLIEPDVWTCPHGVRQRPRKVLTYGPEVADVNAAAGFAPDPQQELGLDLIFAINPDGTPASFEFCVICCRQNLKTGLFKQTAVGWVAVLDEPDVVWSAHEMSTTLDAQAELHDLFESAASLSRWLPNQKNRGLYTDNGSERIELVNPETGQSAHDLVQGPPREQRPRPGAREADPRRGVRAEGPDARVAAAADADQAARPGALRVLAPGRPTATRSSTSATVAASTSRRG